MTDNEDNGFVKDLENNSAPTIEIFGGLFALLLVLFVIISLMSAIQLQERMERIESDGNYKIGWDSESAGFVVVSYPDSLYIIEDGTYIPVTNLCNPSAGFVEYAQRVYEKETQQIIFAITEGGVTTMASARSCLMHIMPKTKIGIGWIIADNELLKSVAMGDIPAHIKHIFNETDVK